VIDLLFVTEMGNGVMKTEINIFEQTFKDIDIFVNMPENNCLKPVTGRFSTPFRGTLFGTSKILTVTEIFKSKQIEILWLGSNPNGKFHEERLFNFLDGRTDIESFYEGFVRQMNSGYFSEQGEFGKEAWDPINAPKRGWKLMSERMPDSIKESILMANFLPWESEKFGSFLNKLSDRDNGLLERILEFCAGLNQRLIEALSPKTIIVPKSVWDSSWLKKSKKTNLVVSAEDAKIDLKDNKKTYSFYVGKRMYKNCETKIIFCYHPSFLNRMGIEGRNKYLDALAKEF